MTSAPAMKPRGIGDDGGERADGRAFRAVVRAGDDHAPPRGGIVAAVELSGGKNPGEKRGHDDRSAEQDDGMRQTQSCRAGATPPAMVLLCVRTGMSAT